MESPPGLESLYTMLREQIQHEDHLVNHRLTWLLAVEGFLFAISVALLTSQNLIVDSKKILFITIGIFGISFCVTSFFSIHAAHNSLKILREKWDEAPTGKQKTINAWLAAKNKYPPITYVGKGPTNAWSAAEGTPWLIIFAWLVLMACLIFNWVRL